MALAEAGAHVALLARTKSQLDEVADIIITKHQRKALVLPADATSESAVTEAFARTEQELGKVDIAVANAASFIFRPFMYTPFDEWWNMMEVNVKGPMFLTQLAMKSMCERNEGVIMIISSKAGIINRGKRIFSSVPGLIILTKSRFVCILYIEVSSIKDPDESSVVINHLICIGRHFFVQLDVCNLNSMQKESRVCTCMPSIQVSLSFPFWSPFFSDGNDGRRREDTARPG